MYLALCSDLVVATPDLRIGNPRWLFSGADGDITLLSWAVGVKRAKQMVFYENVVSGERANQIKLVELLVAPDKLDETIDTIAASLSGIPRANIFSNKRDNLGAYARSMSRTAGRAATLSNALYRQGEFNFLRERRNLGVDAAIEAAKEYARRGWDE
jgi:enoyl-CoA hydratase/carnithine racemase